MPPVRRLARTVWINDSEPGTYEEGSIGNHDPCSFVQVSVTGSPMLDRREPLAFVARELPRYVDETVRLYSRDLDDGGTTTICSQEYLSFT